LDPLRLAEAKEINRLGQASVQIILSLMTPDPSSERADKWLWTVRIFKTRGLATEACRGGSVEVNGQPIKPAREVRAGEIVTVKQGLVTRTLAVVGVPLRRLGPKLVSLYCDDRTPPEELAKGREQPVQQFLAREKGMGRPTKRDRREIERLFG
jgi:ribosome-associated heat shock protein Hsp15